MRAVSGILLLFVASVEVHAQGDNFCIDTTPPVSFRVNQTEAWIVDEDVNDRFNNEFLLSNVVVDDFDADNFFDQALQNLARSSRARVRARVVRGAGDCSIADSDITPCVVSLTNVDDGCADGAVGFATCSTTRGCNVVICQDQNNVTAFKSGRLFSTMQHEIGHAYGLDHVNSDVEVVNGDCAALNTAAGQCLATSAGCDGELMCSNRGCRPGFFIYGDTNGLKEIYGVGVTQRSVFFQRDSLSDGVSVPLPTRTNPERGAGFAPRIACAQVEPAFNGARCAMVTGDPGEDGDTTGEFRVVKLNTPTGTAGWTVQSSIFFSTSIEVSMPPDVAVDRPGNNIYSVIVDNARVTRLRRFDLGGVSTSIVVPSFKPVLPPRIAFADGRVWVLGLVEQKNTVTEGFTQNVWKLVSIGLDGAGNITGAFTTANFASTGVGNTDLDVADASRSVVSDFDFTCRDWTTDASCALVVQMMHDDLDVPLSRARSIRFAVEGSAPGTAQVLDDSWDFGVNDTNGVIGATYVGENLVVSYSRPLTGGTDVANTRVRRTQLDLISSTLVDQVADTSDAEACNSGPAHGFSVGGASMHGGYSIDWCPTCAGGAGTLESVTFGRRFGPNDDTNFCF